MVRARALVDGELDRLAIAEREKRLAGDAALLLGAAGEVVDAAEREHARAVFARHDVAHGLALGAHDGALLADVAVGVDLHLHAAVAEDPFGHDRHHVLARHGLADDEGGGLVVRVGGAGSDGGDEGAPLAECLAVPRLHAIEEGDEALVVAGDLEHRQGVEADEVAAVVGVAVAGAGSPVGDVAEDGAGVAADLVGRRRMGHGAALSAASTLSGVAGTAVRRAPVAWRMALRMAGAVGIKTCSPRPLAP